MKEAFWGINNDLKLIHIMIDKIRNYIVGSDKIEVCLLLIGR
jgi:hypothetical protein